MLGPDYMIFAVTDLSMHTSLQDGDNSFLASYSKGARLTSKSEEMEDDSKEEHIDTTYGFDDFLRNMDIILCGRGTYDQIMTRQQGQWPYPSHRLIVFSETPLDQPVPTSNAPVYPPPANSSAFGGTPQDLVTKLSKEKTRSRSFKRSSVWVLGGPTVRGAMLQLGVVGRVELVVVPTIIKRANTAGGNGGVPLWAFPANEDGGSSAHEDVRLELIDCRSYENGVIALSYTVGNGN
ncbi:hypothetical protein FRC19_008377 [Serendipita sp. 401]|nr:hypothetical protein FRC19_008377 [Serendipita sp. 401]KAG9058754.1 hypothetical protein FS842_003543 [Serendipita sp. 407]